MKEFIITRNEAGQRADKLLAKYLKEAPKSFLYKMMRKKNITLNGKKIQGNEQLSEGDVLRLFLAEETIQKFQGEESAAKAQAHSSSPRMLPNQRRQKLDIIYEDADILLLNKPVGMLSQKAQPQDVSAVESHLLLTGERAAYRGGASALSPVGLQSPGPEYKRDIDCRKESAGSAAGERIAA